MNGEINFKLNKEKKCQVKRLKACFVIVIILSLFTVFTAQFSAKIIISYADAFEV